MQRAGSVVQWLGPTGAPLAAVHASCKHTAALALALAGEALVALVAGEVLVAHVLACRHPAHQQQ